MHKHKLGFKGVCVGLSLGFKREGQLEAQSESDFCNLFSLGHGPFKGGPLSIFSM